MNKWKIAFFVLLMLCILPFSAIACVACVLSLGGHKSVEVEGTARTWTDSQGVEHFDSTTQLR